MHSLVVEGRGQTSECELRICGHFSGLGLHKGMLGSCPVQRTAKKAAATDNLVPGLKGIYLYHLDWLCTAKLWSAFKTDRI